ncbi:uncharacterized protein L203_101876 [Cryptococcus depauperatus CBS 7841]|uniref:Uncharacterized protein n=1 Tax=Cryptococcus depauperatus CBS 7841 TaxID=1295531 RepID=A0A1E3IH40_9TREE|nr:hypothetical protein L203_03117 [Cryptococcus depauperatus CBS 7841]
MKSLFRPFPLPLTGRQWFYLLFLQGLGAGVIDGAANFGVAYAMYHNQKDIKMWVLAKNTVAGDLGVTPVIQCLASMLITSTLVHTDLHHNIVKPLPFVWPHVEHLPDPKELIDNFFKHKRKPEAEIEKEDTSLSLSTASSEYAGGKSWTYHPKMLLRFMFEGTEANILLSPFRPKLFLFKALLTAAQGAAIGVFFGLPLWIIFIIVLGPIYGHDNMVETGWKWAPMVIKCVYGAMLGWVTNPVIASLALGSQAERHLLVIEYDEEEVVTGNGTDGTAVGDAVPTIQEEDELVPPQLSSHSAHDFSALTTTNTPIPPLQRTRARSRTSSILSRPPLTANCSDMPIILSSSQNLSSLTIASSQHAKDDTLTAPQSAPLFQSGRSRSGSSVTVHASSPPQTSIPILGSALSILNANTAASGLARADARDAMPVPPSSSRLDSASMSAGLLGRRRNLTISTVRSNATFGAGTGAAVPGTPNSAWSYALGGTGGKARRNRPRAISSLSGHKAYKSADSGDVAGEVFPATAMTSGSARAVAASATTGRHDREENGVTEEGKGGGRKTLWDVFGAIRNTGLLSDAATEKKETQEKIDNTD